MVVALKDMAKRHAAGVSRLVALAAEMIVTT